MATSLIVQAMEPQEGARPEEAHSDDFRMYEYKVRGAHFEMPAVGS